MPTPDPLWKNAFVTGELGISQTNVLKGRPFISWMIRRILNHNLIKKRAMKNCLLNLIMENKFPAFLNRFYSLQKTDSFLEDTICFVPNVQLMEKYAMSLLSVVVLKMWFLLILILTKSVGLKREERRQLLVYVWYLYPLATTIKTKLFVT